MTAKKSPTKGIAILLSLLGKTLFDYGNLKAEFIAPGKDAYSDLNNYSAVIRLTYKSKHFLFMGDAEKEVENELILSSYDISADVLKVGHHGSSTSTTKEFIGKVKPKFAVISCGKGNSYGHPTNATLTTLNNAGINIYRTDEVGTVVFTSDGVTISVDKNATSIKPNAPPVANKTETPTPTTKVENTKPAVQEEKSVTVYITNTGSKYHRSGCRYLSKSKIATTLEAARQSYGACSVCKPPQ